MRLSKNQMILKGARLQQHLGLSCDLGLVRCNSIYIYVYIYIYITHYIYPYTGCIVIYIYIYLCLSVLYVCEYMNISLCGS